MNEQFLLFDAGPEESPSSLNRRTPLGPAPQPPEIHRLATALPDSLYLGTSSWSFPGWENLVYNRTAVKSELAKDGLESYAHHPLFRTVGLDRTYYGPLDAAQFTRLAEMVPAPFRFLVKAPELSTVCRFPRHPRYGSRSGKRNDTFLDPAYVTDVLIGPMNEGLRNKAGVLVFQFAPQDVSPVGGPNGFVDRLHAFFEALPEGAPYAVEVRNRELLTSRYREALAATGVSHCYNLHPRMPDLVRQAELLPPSQASILVIRWMLGGELDYETAKRKYEPFDRLVDPDPRSRNQVASLLLEAAAGEKKSFVIANNKAEGSAPLSLVQLAAQLARVRSL